MYRTSNNNVNKQGKVDGAMWTPQDIYENDDSQESSAGCGGMLALFAVAVVAALVFILPAIM